MYYINAAVYEEILQRIGDAPIESGGIIGMRGKEICAFCFDDNARTLTDVYFPNVSFLNEVLVRWRQNGIRFVGFVHSHANGYDKPSYNDGVYAQKLLDQNPSLEFLLFPILTISEGEKKLSFYEYVTEFVRKEVRIK